MIEWIFLGTFWIWGFKAIFEHPFIFWKAGLYLENKLPRWLYKPLLRCPVCMSSIHGTFIFLYSQESIYYYPVFIISLAGISYLLVEFLYPQNVENIQEEKKQ